MATTLGTRGGFSLRRGVEKFEKEREKFRTSSKEDLDLAYKTFGFTLVHSLSIDEGTDLLERCGFEPKNAVEYYNRGVVAVQRENYPRAIDQFRRAAEADSSLLDAIYNLAVCYERTKQVPQAISTWQTYLESVKDKGTEEEVKQVKERIAALKAKQK
jgi:tetratricopeptide (TPR) repeat protein